MHQDVLQLLNFFKVMADESRLRMIGLLSHQEYSVDELAALLKIKAPTISHHLARLKEMDLVEMRVEGNSHVYALKTSTLTALSRSLLTRERMATLVDDLDPGEWERKVLRDFLEGERLKEIPASRKKREVILRWLATHFLPNTRYPEREVNRILGQHHPDFATLRRELIGHHLLLREQGVYWKPEVSEVHTVLPSGQ